MKTIKNKNPVILLIIEIFELIKFSANFLIIIPIITGTATTPAIFNAVPVKLIFSVINEVPKILAEEKTIKGTVIMLMMLIIAVNEIDKATSPFANFVKTFDVIPPGAAAIIITPIANSIGVPRTLIKINATIGKIISWQTKPIIKSLG